jgi:hypothetical protein
MYYLFLIILIFKKNGILSEKINQIIVCEAYIILLKKEFNEALQNIHYII